jgi:lauroyl/myristoyl acyltransferase
VVAPEREAVADVAAPPDPNCTPQPVPWGGAVARLRASVGLRRLIPTDVALAASDATQRVASALRPQRLADACAVMEAVVGGTHLEGDIPRLAQRYLESRARQWEYTWRNWELPRTPVDGLENLRTAEATGRGALISFTHYGPFTCWAPVPRLVGRLLTPVGDWLIEKPRPGYEGYQLEHRRRVLCESGYALIQANGSAGPMLRALKNGETTILAMDLPGTTPTRYLGKTVEMTNGTARLATAAGSLVVPGAIVPDGRRWRVQLLTPLDPRDFAKAGDLHQTLAGVHEKIIMRAPEHIESPLRPGGWKTANREGWRVR